MICAPDVWSHAINQAPRGAPFLISRTPFVFLLLFIVLASVLSQGESSPSQRRKTIQTIERVAAVSNRQLALTSAPERPADEMQNRYPRRPAASGCGGFALRFWQGIMGGLVFHVYIEVYEGLA